jgi:hypothetical protein
MMTRMLSFLAGMLCLLLSNTLSAQREVTGTVTDADNRPLPGTTVLLKKLPDTVLVRSMISDEKGQFVFDGIRQGAYILHLSAIGYSDAISSSFLLDSNRQAYTLAPVRLQRRETTMSGVTVRTAKPFLERQVDRTVMNVEAFLSATGSTALEMLEKAPGVNVEEGSGISLRGKSGVVVYIDDKPTYLSGTELINYLKSLPASSLDKIEVITNPPARYDAAGNAGIINIKTKKAKTAGFNGGITINYGQGMYPRTNNSFNYNYRHPRFNLFGTAAYSIGNSMNDLTINRYYFYPDGSPRFTFFQHSFIRRTSWATNLRLGFDYYLSDKTTIGILTNGITRPSTERTGNTSTVRNRAGNIDSLITANNFQDGDWKNGSVNLNLLHKYDGKGKELAIDLDYVTYKSQQDQQFYNQAFAANGAKKWQDQLTGDLPSRISIYSAKTDYSLPLAGGGKVSAGAKVSYVTTDNAANYSWTVDGRTEMDIDKTNHFLYNEGINAVYVNGNKDWKSFSLQLGLRLENTTSDGHQLGNIAKPDSAFSRSYTDLFPTAFFLYKFDTLSNHQLSFSYGRRIDRPVYQDLNPFISPLDKFSIYVGNPYLQPTFTNSFSLAHTFKNKITTTLSYSYTKNVIQETIDLSNNIYVSRPGNIGKSAVLGLGVDVTVKPLKWWSLLGYAEVQDRTYQDFIYGYRLDTSAIYFGSNATNQFTFGKGWSGELSGFYRTGILVGQITSSATGLVGMGVGKKILKDKGSLRLIVRDVFYTRLNHGIIGSIKDAYGTYRNWGDSRNATLTFSYNFGSNGGQQRSRQSATEAEQNRVRS